jgi:hypothetical protein
MARMSTYCEAQEADFCYQDKSSTRAKAQRNSYWILSAQSAFVAFGAWMGVVSGLHAYIGGVTAAIALCATCAMFIYAIDRSSSDIADISIVSGFNVCSGFFLSMVLGWLVDRNSGSGVIVGAFSSAFVVFGAKALMTSLCNDGFSKIGVVVFSAGLCAALGFAFSNLFSLGLASGIGMCLLSAGFCSFCSISTKIAMQRGTNNCIHLVVQAQVDLFSVAAIWLCATGLLDESPRLSA